MALVSTGQFTIIDQNDARPISALLSSSASNQQIYTKQDDTAGTFTPSWFTTNLVLTPTIAIGGLTASQAWARITSRSFSLTEGGTALTAASANPSNAFVDNSDVVLASGAVFGVTNITDGATSAPTLVIKGNVKSSAGPITVWFKCTYTDIDTQLSNTIECNIILSSIATGTNATFIQLRGVTSIQESDTGTKNAAAIAADLYRGGNIDTTGLTYKWYDSAGTQISTSTPSYTTLYAASTSVAPAVPTAVATNGANIPTSGAGMPNIQRITIDRA